MGEEEGEVDQGGRGAAGAGWGSMEEGEASE